jgi:hypothetical protein
VSERAAADLTLRRRDILGGGSSSIIGARVALRAVEGQVHRSEALP